jgi:hypothetical protein
LRVLCNDRGTSPEEFRGRGAAMGKPELANDIRFKDHLSRLKEEMLEINK